MIMLNAIINYISEHLKLSDISWSFKGLDTDHNFNPIELLKLIYYIDPETFARMKKYVEEKQDFLNSISKEKED